MRNVQPQTILFSDSGKQISACPTYIHTFIFIIFVYFFIFNVIEYNFLLSSHSTFALFTRELIDKIMRKNGKIFALMDF